MECAENLRYGFGRCRATVVELHAAAQCELPMPCARITLPRDGQRWLRAALRIQVYEGVADQREGARGIPVVGGRGVRGKLERVRRRLQHDAQSSAVVRTRRRGGTC